MMQITNIALKADLPVSVIVDQLLDIGFEVVWKAFFRKTANDLLNSSW
jgi:hypothetical protein